MAMRLTDFTATINTEEPAMKKTLSSLLVVVLLFLALAAPALAGGDKVRGENGEGSVNQVQIQNPPPFQP